MDNKKNKLSASPFRLQTSTFRLLTSGFWLLTSYFLLLTSSAQTLSAADIVSKADAQSRQQTTYAEMTMQIVRPKYTREISLKSWSKGDKLALIKITAPAKDVGSGYLKINKELWNWLPNIDRLVKMSASVMGQSWMGSDFTNDDMVRQSSMVTDYKPKLLNNETLRGFDCYKIELIPLPNAAVVWGKVLIWIDTKEFLIIKTENYDEDMLLAQTMDNYDFKTFTGKMMPTRIEIIPADKPGQKTVVTIQKAEYNKPIEDGFFSQQNLKKQ
jgi:outer membrane lipoprotein-sorting protein